MSPGPLSSLKWRHFASVAALLTLLGLAPQLQAQPLRPEPEPPSSDRVDGQFGTTVSIGQMARDIYFNITPFAQFRFNRLRFSRDDTSLFEEPQVHDLELQLEAPLLLLVIDQSPIGDGSRLRSQTWDEPGEWLRVLRWAQVGSPYDGLYFRSGELSNIRLGHRTIVDSYANSLDIDHFQWGFQHNLNTVHGGAEAFIDNVVRPEVMGLRLWLRPASFGDASMAARRLALGLTFAGDLRAPTLIAQEPGRDRYARNRHDDPLVEATGRVGMLGADIEYAAVVNERVSITPYVDFNSHLGEGVGLHTGAFAGIKFGQRSVLDLRAEYRFLGSHYTPTFFGRLYEVERLAWDTPDGEQLALPKLTWTRGFEGARRHGWSGEVGFNFDDKIFVAGGFAGEEGTHNSSAWLQVRAPITRWVQFGTWYVNPRFEGFRGFFSKDGAMLATELRVFPLPWLYADFQLRRRWTFDTDRNWVARHDWWLGAGVSFGF